MQPLRAPEEPQPPLQLLPLPAQVPGEGFHLPDALSLLHSLAAIGCSVVALHCWNPGINIRPLPMCLARQAKDMSSAASDCSCEDCLQQL